MPPSIYHITKFANLQGIARAGRLEAKNVLQQHGVAHASIAYDNIQDRRAQRRVPCGPRGVLHDYVPFYFAPRSPMLYAISRGFVAGCPEGQQPVVHLVVDVDEAVRRGMSYVFTDGHAVVAYSRFFDDVQNIDKVDWKIMESNYWNDTPEYPDRKRRRQAEFLVHEALPWELVHEIGVINNTTLEQVRQTIQGAAHQPAVVVRRAWYY